jgi:type VI secretion system protein ImpC
MSEPQAPGAWLDRRGPTRGAKDGATAEVSVLDQIVEEGRLGSDLASRERGRDLVREFIAQVLEGSMTIARDATSMISARIAQIDHLLSIQVNEVLHHPNFQKLESAWRGLYYLVDRTSWYQGVNVRVLNVSKRELLRDFQKAASWRGSALYKAVVDLHSETLGSAPFDVLVGNYAFDNSPEDVETLEGIARIASEGQSPFLAATSPAMFGCGKFSQVFRATGLTKACSSTDHAKWKSLRRSVYSKFVVLSLPNILIRKPDSSDPTFAHYEGVDGTDFSKFLWGNPAWAIAAQLGRAFGKGSWCADPSSIQGGNVIVKLPSFDFATDEGDMECIGPTEASVSDSAYSQLREIGFAPVCLDANGSRAVVYELPTAHQACDTEDEDGEIHRARPTMLRDVLIQSRLAHYIKCIVREKRSWFKTPIECEQYLNRWAEKYTVVQGRENSPEQRMRPFLRAKFRLVREETATGHVFRVKGQVLPNLGSDQACDPIDVSVPVVLTRLAADWRPPTNLTREDEPAESIAGSVEGATAPPTTDGGDAFLAASNALEKIADLRRRNILDEPDYIELKGAILVKMKQIVAPQGHPTLPNANAPNSPLADYEVPYAQLHEQIVDLIAASYRSGADERQRARQAITEMDERGALNSGDNPLLNELIDAALSDAGDNLSDQLGRVTEIAARIRDHETSPASKAIVDTAEQSGKRAVREYDSEEKLGAGTGVASALWRKLVWPDVEGAFSGGAAAAAASSALATSSFAWPVQIVAAFGVVIGAGLRSGVAYGEHGFPTQANTH